MSRELGKSILLFLLVGISLTLTWSIWSYQGDYAPTNSSEPAKITTIASSYDLDQVVKPYQIVRYDADQPSDLKGQFGNAVDPLYNLLLNATFSPEANLPEKFPRAEGNVYELVFPTPISTTIIKDIFNFNTTNTSSISQDWLIDQVQVFRTQTNSNQAYVVFQDQTGRAKFYAKGDINGFSSFNKNVNSSTNWLDYMRLPVKDHTVLVPNETIHTVPVESHLYSLIGFDIYKPILFNNPRQVVYSGNSYSDGVSQLTNKQKLVMQYYNSVSSSSGSYGDPIFQSYNFIEGHKGWTNKFNIDDYTSYPAKGQAKVTFRLTANGLPVFSTQGYPYDNESLISIQLNGGELSQLNRTLIDVGVSYKESTEKTVTSARDTLSLLEKTGAFQTDNITDFRLGYQMSVDQNNRSVTYTPTWFFKQNDIWISVTDFLNDHSNDIQAKRGGGR